MPRTCRECKRELDPGWNRRHHYCSLACKKAARNRWAREIEDATVGGSMHEAMFDYDDSDDVHHSITGGDRKGYW